MIVDFRFEEVQVDDAPASPSWFVCHDSLTNQRRAARLRHLIPLIPTISATTHGVLRKRSPPLCSFSCWDNWR